MRDILFICHRIPFPPDRGDKIRSHNILKSLVKLAPVHVATFADDDFDIGEESELAALAASYCLARRAKPLVFAGLQAIAGRQPVSLSAFHDRAIARYVDDMLKSGRIGTIYVFSGQMAQYIPESFKGRVIVDFVDVDSAKFDAYAERDRGVIGWIEAREGRLLRLEEARIAARADVSLLISKSEADLFRARLPERVQQLADVRVVGNGIDSRFFDPSLVGPETRMLDCPGPRVIFTGQMDYAPNVDAVERAARKILPLIRERMPDASFHIVGRNPTADVMALGELDGCHVWGRVDDVRPWLKAADLAIVPLSIARGVQNKVLEAMSMALPVVMSPAAADGIGGEHGRHFRIGIDDAALARESLVLLQDARSAAANGEAARRYVCEHAGWRGALAELPDILGQSGRTVRNVA